MCFMCNDEKAYASYLTYLDAMERAGEIADPDKAMDMLIEELQKSDSGGLAKPHSFSCEPVDE
jgi:hypothetical protein